MKSSRQPRVPFSSYQQDLMEKQFQVNHYLSASTVSHLSKALDLTEQRIKIWFQNRRARDRRENKRDNEKVTSLP